MATVSVSLDTESRMIVMTIDGNMVAADEVNISKYVDYENKERISFSYTKKNTNEAGLVTREIFFLPEEDADSDALGENGLAVKKEGDENKAIQDTIKYMYQHKQKS